MSQKPVYEINVGRLQGTVWENHSDGKGKTFTTVISRIYCDGKQLRTSGVFYRDDLPHVARIADMAFAWIWNHGSATEPVSTRS